MDNTLIPFNLYVTFEFADGTYKEVKLADVMRGVRQNNLRPINARVPYEHLILLTREDEQMFRRKLIDEILPAMQGGYRYNYCDKDVTQPLQIKKV